MDVTKRIAEYIATTGVEDFPPDAVEALRQTKKVVTSHSFTSLLQYVYKKYPAYSARSVMR